jgi:hypothetical protein
MIRAAARFRGRQQRRQCPCVREPRGAARLALTPSTMRMYAPLGGVVRSLDHQDVQDEHDKAGFDDHVARAFLIQTPPPAARREQRGVRVSAGAVWQRMASGTCEWETVRPLTRGTAAAAHAPLPRHAALGKTWRHTSVVLPRCCCAECARIAHRQLMAAQHSALTRPPGSRLSQQSSGVKATPCFPGWAAAVGLLGVLPMAKSGSVSHLEQVLTAGPIWAHDNIGSSRLLVHPQCMRWIPWLRHVWS